MVTSTRYTCANNKDLYELEVYCAINFRHLFEVRHLPCTVIALLHNLTITPTDKSPCSYKPIPRHTHMHDHIQKY